MTDPRIGAMRRPWLAGVLSLFQPGLGPRYAGGVLRGALALAGLLAATFIAVVVPLTVSPGPWVAVFSPVVATLYLAVAVDAVLLARRAPVPYFRKSYNAWPSYAA